MSELASAKVNYGDYLLATFFTQMSRIYGAPFQDYYLLFSFGHSNQPKQTPQKISSNEALSVFLIKLLFKQPIEHYTTKLI
jgi:hypothetical protein